MCHMLTNSRAAADAVLGDSLGMPLSNDMSDGGGPLRGRAKINVTCRFRIDGRSDRFISLLDDPKQSSGRSPMLSVRACLVCVTRRRTVPRNARLLRPDRAERRRSFAATRSTCARRALSSQAASSSVQTQPGSCVGLGVAAPISTGLTSAQATQGTYQLKGAYHVSLRHSFNRRHYRHGTC